MIKCIGPEHKHCPNEDFQNDVNLGSSDSQKGTIPDDPGSTNDRRIARFYPTRLIELGLIRDETVRLIVTRNGPHRNDMKLEEPKGQYVTLSHCWGKTNKPFCLIESNLDIFRTSGIPLEELPQTFQDSIHFARRLGSNIKYIWIDSLCIIQGDKADWLHESIQMYQVYRKSYCNLSATAAKDGSRGLYADRDPQYLWNEDVDLNTRDMLRVKGAGDPCSLETLIQRCTIVDPSLWKRKVDAAPVNTRAWVLQERLLSPRVLHFCDDQVAWECRELDASEVASDGIERLELRSGVIQERLRFKNLAAQEYGPKGSLESMAEITYKTHENWKRIIERYSLTNLTNANDKLIALAGIAEQMSSQIDSEYITGMWRKYFASQLLWRVEPMYKNGKFLYPSRRPKEYRAPSFSWAAIDAPQGIRCGETQEESNLLIKVTEVAVQPQLPNSRFGLVKKGGYIKIICQRLAIAIERKSRRTENGEQPDVYIWTLTGDREGEDAKMHPNVYLDSPEDDFEAIRGWHSSMWLVPAYKNSSGDLVCLLLQQKKDNHDHFCRVGLSIIPRYVSARNEFMNETSVDENGEFKGVRKREIQIV